MNMKDRNFKPGKSKVPRSNYFSSKKPRLPSSHTFSGGSKKKS